MAWHYRTEKVEAGVEADEQALTWDFTNASELDKVCLIRP